MFRYEKIIGLALIVCAVGAFGIFSNIEHKEQEQRRIEREEDLY